MLHKIGGIWKKTNENGDYLKGRMDFPVPLLLTPGTEVLLFKSKSSSANAPHYDLMIDAPRQKQDDEVFDE